MSSLPAKMIFGSAAFLVFGGILNATSYNYKVSEILPCLPGTCSGRVELGGTITVDQLGNLEEDDVTGWNLSIGSGSSSPVNLTQANSAFNAAGSLQIVASLSDLTFTVSESGDGFNFLNSKTGAGWLYGAFTSAAQFLNYPAGNGKVYQGYQLLTLPTTFTAESFGLVGNPPPLPLPLPAPEPASLALMLLAAGSLMTLTRKSRHHSTRRSVAQSVSRTASFPAGAPSARRGGTSIELCRPRAASKAVAPPSAIALAAPLLACCCLFNTSAALAQSTQAPGATDPVSQAARWTLFPQTQLFMGIPTAGFDTSSNAYTASFLTLQFNSSLNGFNNPGGVLETGVGVGQNTIAVAGRFVDPNLQQVVYPTADSGAIGFTANMQSGKYPSDYQTLSSVTNASVDFPDCRYAFAYGHFLDMAAGDLDGNVDQNGNRHDELVVACRDSSSPGSTSDPSVASTIALYVVDYAAWVGDTQGSYNPASSTQNSYLPAITKANPPTPETQSSQNVRQTTSAPLVTANYRPIRLAVGDFLGTGQNLIALVYGTTNNSFVVSIYQYTNDGQGHRGLTQVKTTTLGASPTSDSDHTYNEEPDFAVAAGNFDGAEVTSTSTSTSTTLKDRLVVSRVLGVVHYDHGYFKYIYHEFNVLLDVIDFDSNLNASISSTGAQNLGSTVDFGDDYNINSIELPKVELVSGLFQFNPADAAQPTPSANVYNYNRRQLAAVYNVHDRGLRLFPLSIYQDQVTYLLGNQQYTTLSSSQNVNTFSVAASQFRLLSPSATATNPPATWSVAISAWQPVKSTTSATMLWLYDLSPCITISATGSAPADSASCPVVDFSNDVQPLSLPIDPSVTLPFTAFDYAGNSLYLGAPVHLTTQALSSLSFILQEPPKHAYYDIFSDPNQPGSTYGTVVSIDRSDSFNTKLVDTTGNSYSVNRQDAYNQDLGVSANYSAALTVKAGLNDGIEGSSIASTTTFSAQVAYDKNSNNSTIQNQLETDTVSSQGQTDHDDYLTGYEQSYDIWRYRVFGQSPTTSNAFVEFVIPGPKSAFTTPGINDDDYQPIQENGNVLSYPLPYTDPTTGVMSYTPSDMGSFQILSSTCTGPSDPNCTSLPQPLTPSQQLTLSGTSGSIQVDLSNSLSNANSVSTAKNLKENASLSESISANTSFGAGPDQANVDSNVTVGVGQNGAFSWTNSNTATVTANTDTNFTISYTSFASSQGYTIYPVLYFATDGTMEVAYGADVRQGSFWQSIYGGKPDAALNLPLKFVPVYSQNILVGWQPNPDPTTNKAVRGLNLTSSVLNPISGQFDPLYGAPVDGDHVRIQSLVYNYSVATTEHANVLNRLAVNFELISFDSGTGKETDMTSCPNGDLLLPDHRCLVSISNIPSLAPLANTTVTGMWNTYGYGPQGDTGGTAEYHLYVVLDPKNTIDEIYEGVTGPGQNNEGFIVVDVVSRSSTGLSATRGDSWHESPRHLSMREDSLAAIDHRYGLRAGTVEAYYGQPLPIRVGAYSSRVSRRHNHIWVYDGHARQGELLARKVLHSGRTNGSFAWFDWVPTRLGTYTLHAKVIQDRDDTALDRDNEVALQVNVVPAPPANRR